MCISFQTNFFLAWFVIWCVNPEYILMNITCCSHHLNHPPIKSFLGFTIIIQISSFFFLSSHDELTFPINLAMSHFQYLLKFHLYVDTHQILTHGSDTGAKYIDRMAFIYRDCHQTFRQFYFPLRSYSFVILMFMTVERWTKKNRLNFLLNFWFVLFKNEWFDWFEIIYHGMWVKTKKQHEELLFW